MQQAQTNSYIGKDMKTVKAVDLENERDTLRASEAAAVTHARYGRAGYEGGRVMDKAIREAIRKDQAILEALTGEEQPLYFIDEHLWDWPGCGGSAKWLSDKSVWRCPVCDTEYSEHGEPFP